MGSCPQQLPRTAGSWVGEVAAAMVMGDQRPHGLAHSWFVPTGGRGGVGGLSCEFQCVGISGMYLL